MVVLARGWCYLDEWGRVMLEGMDGKASTHQKLKKSLISLSSVFAPMLVT